MSIEKSVGALVICCLTTGCVSLPEQFQSEPNSKTSKTLMSWSAPSKDDSGEKEETKEDGKQDNKTTERSKEAKESASKEEPNEIAADRPDFTESSTTVGKGKIQLESGYTLSRNRDTGERNGHSYPEALLRIGLFADWFELRIGQNYSSTNLTATSTDGLEDLYLGVKLALTEQKKFFPETAFVIQATVPTGPDNITAGKTLPGVNFLFGWDVIPDQLTMAGSVQGNAAVTDAGNSYLELAQSFTMGYSMTRKLGCYLEVFGKEPFSANVPDIGPEYYLDGGFTYKFTPNFQYDVRAGVGLNRYSDDYFIGTGFAVRY